MKEWCYYFILAKRLGRETYPDMSNTLGTSVCGMCVCTQICVYILPYAMQNQGTLLLFGEFGAWITHNRKNGSGAPSCDQCFQFSSFQSLSHVRLFVTPWTAAQEASLAITNSQSLLKLMCIASVMPSNHLILCRPLLLLPSIFPSIRLFSNESVLHIKPKY